MADSRYREQLWTPGQPMDPTDPVMKPAELSQRLLHLERRLENLDVADLPVTDLQRKLEQSWRPDPAVLFDKGLIAQDLLTNGSNSWTDLPIAPGFNMYDASNYAQYRKLSNGVVIFRGLVKTPAVSASTWTTFATMPEGFRPARIGSIGGTARAAYGTIAMQHSAGNFQLGMVHTDQGGGDMMVWAPGFSLPVNAFLGLDNYFYSTV